MSRSVSCLRCWWRGRGRDRVRLGRMVVAASVVVVRGDRLVDRLGRGLDERRARRIGYTGIARKMTIFSSSL